MGGLPPTQGWVCITGSWPPGESGQGPWAVQKHPSPAVAPRPPALQLLLKDPAPSVRMKAAETLGRLVKFV